MSNLMEIIFRWAVIFLSSQFAHTHLKKAFLKERGVTVPACQPPQWSIVIVRKAAVFSQ